MFGLELRRAFVALLGLLGLALFATYAWLCWKVITSPGDDNPIALIAFARLFVLTWPGNSSRAQPGHNPRGYLVLRV